MEVIGSNPISPIQRSSCIHRQKRYLKKEHIALKAPNILEHTTIRGEIQHIVSIDESVGRLRPAQGH
ncbi:MAG TPA: hypothetical protein DHU26_01765 [Spirochaetaceae bacterium]|nr:hypothetical protein [Spirochaetaceae bacterium]